MAAIVGLRQQGKSTDEICTLVKMPRAHVMSREMGALRARPRRGCRTVTLPEHLTLRLEQAAKGRNVGPGGLAYRLIDAILRDGLVDAVLDEDGRGSA